MTTCDICKKEVPDIFIAPMFHDGQYYHVDPECALKMTGGSSFQGEMAQEMLENFREWRDNAKTF